jgi:hypothetical protein
MLMQKKNNLFTVIPFIKWVCFENTYATYKGDSRASDDSYYSYFDKTLPFPVMNKWFDTGEDLKRQVKRYCQ